jgi:hypothetical protein
MDNQPQTRKERKPGKYKQVFNQKTVRAKESLAEKRANKPQEKK